MCEYLLWNLTRVNANLFIDSVEQIEGIGEHVAGTASRIAKLDVLGFGNTQKIGFDLLRRDVILHLLDQARVRMIEHPQTTQRILDQITHNPVWRKQLGGGGNIFRSDFLVFLKPFKYLVFLFRDIELVEPTDDFHVLTGIWRHRFTSIGKNGITRQQIVRHQQFGIVGNAFKQIRHRAVRIVTSRHDKQPISFLLRIAASDTTRQ